jgi:P4 family phage/plasmid primase-like protien
VSGFPGLREALEVAAREAAERQLKAAESQARAAALRAELNSGSVTDRADAQRKYGQAALLDEVGILALTEQGGRNNQLYKSAAALGECVAAGVLDLDEVQGELMDMALAIGLGKGEAETTLHSGLTKGQKSPRDLSKVGRLVGKKKAKASGDLAHAIARAEPEAGSTITADEIPDPEGEGGSYSDEQLRELLALPWPVVGIDTDKAHSFRLKDHAGEDLGYVAELGGYVAWNGQQWLHGGQEGAGQVEAKRRVQGLGVYMRPEVDRLLNLYGVLDLAAKRAAQESGADSKHAKQLARKAAAMEKAYYSHGRAARSTESDNKQKAILSSARTLYVKNVQLFEPKPWVVGFKNGTWDRGTFRPAQREDYMLTLAAVEYEATSDQRDWLEVLERITGGDTDLASTLQDVAGYALSGASSLRLLPWLYGEGGTGKGTFSEMLATVLGDMAETINPKYLATDGDRERLGALIWGKRVALCAEAGNARLDAESLKTLSGGDRLSVRRLYAEAFTTRASHVLVMVANDAPRVEAYDDALKDRVLALPFNHRLDAGPALLNGKRVEELRQDAESSLVLGFVSWAVEGLERVHRTGQIHRAAVCQAATRAFWSNVDPLHDFWLEQELSELVMGVAVSGFRARYETWCSQGGRGRPLGAQKFNKACLSVGLEQVKGTGGKRFVKLLEPTRFPVDPGNSGKSGNSDPDSSKANSSSHTRKEEEELWENGPKVATLATRTVDKTLAPASGEL